MKQLLLMPVLILLMNPSLKAQQTVVHPSEIKYNTYHDVSPPIREMQMLVPGSEKVHWKNGEIPNNPLPFDWNDQNQNLGKSTEIDPVLQDKMGVLDPINTIVNFNGIASANGSTYPPDPNGAAGLDYYIQTVNTSFAIYSKTGDSVYGPASLGTLWQGFPGYHGSDGDPIVLFDHLANRWLISQFSLPNYPNGPYYELIAVSQTEDPLGAWHRYSFKFTNMPDYPKLSVWPDGYYFSVKSFSSGALNWVGPLTGVLERDSMLAGSPARMVFFQMGTELEPMLPAGLDGSAPPAGTPGYFLMAMDNALGDSIDQLQLFQLHVDWADSANSIYSGPITLNSEPFDLSMCSSGTGCIPQKGTSRKLDALSHFMMFRLQYRNFGSYQALLANHAVDADGSNHAGVRWYEIRKNGDNWFIYQQSTYAPDSLHRWNASIAMDGLGNIALGYSISGNAIFPSIGITGQRSGDILNHMTCLEEMIVNGAGAQTGDYRWGDYSSLVLDPSDDETFWYTNMYYTTTSQTKWSTRIASFTINNLQVDVNEPLQADYKSHKLRKNFPNPFSTSTTIRWLLTSQADVSVLIHDLTGKTIKKLVGEKQKAGEHWVEFDASGLPSGVYICRFAAEKTIETQKLILIK